MPDEPSQIPTPPHQPTPREQAIEEAIAEAKKLGWRVGIPAIISLSLPALGGFILVGSAIAVQKRVESFGESGVLVFAIIYALTTGLALMPTYALSFASGVFFGFKTGGMIAVPSIVCGAIIGYLIAAVVARGRTSAVIEQNEKARIIRDALLGKSLFRTTFLVTLLRLPPNSPFALTNLVMSSVRVHPLAYIIGTAIGITPRTLAAVFIGYQAGKLTKESVAEGWPQALIAMAISIVVMLIAMALIFRWSKAALARELRRG